MADLASRRLYLCTSDRPDLEGFVAACISGGVDVVQLREKNLMDRELLARAAVARRVCVDRGVPFILNDRPDLALACEADGVHIGQDDIPPAVARAVLGPSAIIGLSTHDTDQLEASRREPLDYISAGPVVHTATHPDRTPTGLAYVTAAVAHAGRPVWVTGGASPSSVGEIVAAGGRHVVVVRWLTEATDPEAAARALRRALDDAIARASEASA